MAVAGSLGKGSLSLAQESYPTRPVRLIVPYPAGGATDVMARLIGAHVSQTLGQQIVVDNRGGAEGMLGTAAVARAEPDGYTFGMVLDTFAVNPSLHKDMAFDTKRDLKPLALIGRTPLILVVNSAAKVRSVPELVTRLRESPESVSFASIGAGSRNRLAAEVFMAQAGVKMLHVPYRGGGPAIKDLIAGQVHSMFLSTTSSLPNIRGGMLIPLAVCTTERLKELPDVPTVAEVGYPNLVADNWYGLVAPAGTPDAITRKLYEATKAAVSDPNVAKRLGELGVLTDLRDGPAFAAFIDSEIDKWSKVIREANIKVE